ncbi:hypothetical protein HELRODRAFT_164914 [Helobdella robusta]|uniref:GIY-YIG domain-containing protein n=1 Tax=Helobdella robusta TaxID=6412 RepID=T1EVZ0_HELRO|nr:hypothetical protein HELRODRAFT_164914 [Helobdella robusta]ESN92797.1 hypothetical protein HELRODRAFT_164914 [Helobdella robusta]
MGLPVVSEYRCLCGADVSSLGYHGLSCKLGSSRQVNDNNENVKNNSSHNHNVTDNDNHVSIDHNSHNNTSNTDNNTRNNTNNNDDNISDNNTNNNDRRIINDHDNDNINNNENNGNHVTIAQVIVDNLINNDSHVISNNLVSNVNNSNNDVVADHIGDNDANSITNSNNNNSDNNDDHVDHDNDNNTINDNLVIANSIHNNNNNSNNNTDSAKLTLFYRNLMSSSYKEDEYIIRKIIEKGVHPVDSNEKINLLIYYKNFKSQQLLIKNSPNVKLATTQHSHVIYQFLCPHEDCRLRPSSYIGMTNTKLTRRLTCHLNIGAPNQHYHDCHNQQLSRKILEDNTKILMKDTNFNRLQILESLFINIYKPNLNKQIYSNFILPSSRNV